MPSKYQLWLTYNGETEKIQFPVLPEVINIKNGSGNKSVSVAGLGEIVVKQDPTAVIISFSCFFPAAEFPGIQVKSITPPQTLVDKITKWKNSDKPVHFIITGTSVNLFCTIEDFPVSEKKGDVGTIYYSITLKEYREVAARQIKIENSKAVIPSNSAPERTDNRVPPKTYTVVSGDCLWNIAKKYLGSGSRYIDIYNLNTDIIKNPNLIYPGQVLKLPT
ncbi:MAG: LysM peptidoglycan-binding domain-containing protein [Oscillospiraceae bacterium]|nr:LysM peptidoglycan-binding domain-containing protein [Oscillospiraceae bacterium]